MSAFSRNPFQKALLIDSHHLPDGDELCAHFEMHDNNLIPLNWIQPGEYPNPHECMEANYHHVLTHLLFLNMETGGTWTPDDVYITFHS